MRFITAKRGSTLILGALLVALLSAPPSAFCQEDVSEQLNQAIAERDNFRELVELAKENVKQSHDSTLKAQGWSSLSRAAARTAQKYAYSAQLFANALSMLANGQVEAAENVAQKGDQLSAKAENSSKVLDRAVAQMEKGNFSQAILLARNVQPEPQPEEAEAVAAAGPAETQAMEVVAGGPGEAAQAIPDFAPVDIDAIAGSTE